MSRIALTGTPGTGKTTLAALLANEGMSTVALGPWAKELDAVAGHDGEDEADVIDLEVLAQHVGSLPPDVVVDGHLSHLLPVDGALVLRCRPDVLQRRLEARGYPPRKVAENVEAEAMDLVLQEALELPFVIQRDTTQRDAAAVLASLGPNGLSAKTDVEDVDWSDWL